jgi:NDP-sugar pyrophosphorylase family protein
VEIALSHEPGGPYDTGGGLLAATHLFREDGPILLHNVDVLSRIPLDTLVAEHRAARQHLKDRLVATLAVQDRPSGRRLLFDDEGLMGWVRRAADGAEKAARRVREPAGAVRDLAFAGIHVVEPALFPLNERRGTFPIVELYLDLAERGYVIRPADVSRHPWHDVGTPERLLEAEQASW